jgi:hypothetical protein
MLRQEAEALQLELAESLAGLCQLLVASGDTAEAEPLARQLYEIGASHDVPRRRQSGLHYLADCALIDGEFAEAEERYTRGLRHARRWGLMNMCTEELLGVAMSAGGRGDHERAVRLAAASKARKEVLGYHGTSVFWSALQERHIGGARKRLSSDELERAERTGAETPFDAVLDEVVGPDDGT